MKNNMETSPRIFFGWWTVLATGFLSGFGQGFYGFGISVFFKDLAADLGLSRAITSLASGLGRLEGGIMSPLTGWLSDRYGPKWVIFTGVCIAGTGMIIMNFITSVWGYIIAWGIFIGMGMNIGLTVAVDKALNDWFVLRRGLAQGTKFGLIGVVSVIVLPIVTILVMTTGWRTTCLIWGCFMLICSPLTLFFVKQKRPEYYGMLPDGKKVALHSEKISADMNENGTDDTYGLQETDFTFKQAVKTRTYWLLVLVFGIQMLIMGGINIHIIPFLTDIGIDRAQASSLMAMMVFFTIPSRFFGGILTDLIGKKKLNLLLACGFLIQTAGLAIFLMSQSIASVYIFLVLYGLASGASTPLFILTLGRYFGRYAFGSIFGSSMAMWAPVGLFAPVLSGWIFDTTGSYIVAFVLYTVFAAIASLIMCLVKPVKLQ